jgi:hypothetical protein
VEHLIEGIEQAELGVRQSQAARLRAIFALHERLPTDRSSAAGDAVLAEIACTLRVSMRTASRLYDEAILICSRRRLIDALDLGTIDLSRAKLIATLLPTSDLQDLWEERAVSYARTHTTHELRRWLLARLPDSGDADARADAFQKRYIDITPARDGMSELYGYLPTEVAEAFYGALDGLARNNATPDDDRTLDQRRADAVADLLDERTTVTTTVSVVLPASGRGASVNGSPIPWSTGWWLACEAQPTWFAWLAAPDGRIINTSPAQYRIPVPLARTVRARDQHCRFPGCHVPAARCDLDHLVPFPFGETSYENLHCLCRRHHRIKHLTGWSVVNLGDSELEWTSPAGRTYRTKPPDALDYAA